MQIDNMEEARKLLVDVNELFMNLDDVKKDLENKINIKDDETIDYLHELEIAKLNAREIMKTAHLLIKIRRERRQLKDRWELVKTLKGYTDIYITKGIIANTERVINNIDNLKNNQDTREYTPKVVMNLKCAKKKKEE